MAGLIAMADLRFVMEYDYFIALYFFFICGEYLCSLDSRCSYYRSVAIGDEQNLAELDRFARFPYDAVDVDNLSGFNLILLSTRFN